jgi:hypothetical protein
MTGRAIYGSEGYRVGIYRVAKKTYHCHLCGAEIRKGARYVWRKPFWRDGGFAVCAKHFEGGK